MMEPVVLARVVQRDGSTFADVSARDDRNGGGAKDLLAKLVEALVRRSGFAKVIDPANWIPRHGVR